MGPEVILGLARNFMESRILLTGAELNLFTVLTPVPLSAEEVTARIGSDLRATTILLDGLSAMELLAKQAGKYQCPPAISPFLSAEAPHSILPMILHMAHVWERWAGLTGIVKGVRVQEKPTAPSQDAEELRAFIGAMHAIAEPFAPRIVAAVNPGAFRGLLDVPGPDSSTRVLVIPDIEDLTTTYFVSLSLDDSTGNPVSRNFYWLSTKPDVVEEEKTKDTAYTPTRSYADFTALGTLPEVDLKVGVRFEKRDTDQVARVSLENPSRSLAFFVHLRVTGGQNGEEILPVLWQDNYLSLLPGERREVTARYAIDRLKGAAPVLQVNGWNIKPKSVFP